MHMMVPAIALLSGCATPLEQTSGSIGSATIMDRAGSQVGAARLFRQNGEIVISVSLTGLAEGTHAVHLHTFGDCGASDFSSAGGHLNPAGVAHGEHLGDLPNAQISAAGMGTMSTILSGSDNAVLAYLFDADGTAIIVHEDADDYRSDPAGAAGSRIACGVLRSG